MPSASVLVVVVLAMSVMGDPSDVDEAIGAGPKPECRPPKPVAERFVQARLLDARVWKYLRTCRVWTEDQHYECRMAGRLMYLAQQTSETNVSQIVPVGESTCRDMHSRNIYRIDGYRDVYVSPNETTSSAAERSGTFACQTEGQEHVERTTFITLADQYVSISRDLKNSIRMSWGEYCTYLTSTCSDGTVAAWSEASMSAEYMSQSPGYAQLFEGPAKLFRTAKGLYVVSDAESSRWAYRLNSETPLEGFIDEAYATERPGLIAVLANKDGNFSAVAAPLHPPDLEDPNSAWASRAAQMHDVVADQVAEEDRLRQEEYARCLGNRELLQVSSQVSQLAKMVKELQTAQAAQAAQIVQANQAQAAQIVQAVEAQGHMIAEAIRSRG